MPYLSMSGPEGKRRFEMAVGSDDGLPYMAFFDKREKPRVILSLSDNRPLLYTMNESAESVAGFGESANGGGLAYLAYPNGNRAVELGASTDHYGYLSLCDQMGTNRVSVLAGDASGMIIRDPRENTAITLLRAKTGYSALEFASPSQIPLATLGIGIDEASFLQMFDAQGYRRIWAGHYQDGGAGFQLISTNGTVSAQLP